MTQTVQSHTPFSTLTLLDEGIKTQSTNLIGRVRNVLTGRVFANWRETLLSLATVYYVIKAAVSFFTGHWLLTLVEFSTAGFMAVLRKEIVDFTNLHKATASYREQNMEFALNNLDLRRGISEFQAEVKNLQQESARFQSSNEEYAHNNAVHKSLLDTLERTTVELGDEIRLALNSGQRLSGRILEKFLEGVDRMKEEKQLLEGFTGEMREEHLEQLEQLDRILQQVKQTGNRHIQMVHDAKEEIQQSQQILQEIRDDLQNYRGQAQALKREIEHLQKVRRGLQEDELRIRKTIGDLESAASRNVASANFVAGTFKALFFSVNEHGEASFTTDKMFIPLLVAALAARSYFSN